MATYVLVHGAWHGAWCWRRVERLLRARGHEVYAPTLTGLAERSHLLSADVDLNTHIEDVVNLVQWEGLDNIVLVGHSYGGVVISGIAEKIENKIASIVFLDAFIPETGQRLTDLTVQLTRNLFDEAQEKGEIAVPARTAASFNVNEKDRAWVDAQCTPQPIKTMTQKLSLTGARDRIGKKSYIRAAAYPNEPFDLAKAKAEKNGWRTFDCQCGHDVMLDMPDRLADILHDVA